MARLMHVTSPEVFRAIVTTSTDGRPDFVLIYGPFEDKRQASAAITRAKRDPQRWYYGDPKPTVTGTVQRAALVWEDVE
ncbi:SPOR domain-containing protein [Kribbella sp. NBC_01505]|uniref:SPOR domain-containing protein n=1 Tax=Kribbella sp. NBC_01505 TaxID=2903580 RepID=UPI00386624AE